MAKEKNEITKNLEETFGTSDLYQILGTLDRTCSPSKLKTCYYKCALVLHPDRVSTKQKEEATKKFQLLSYCYQILSDQDKRKFYDETGLCASEDTFQTTDWSQLWKTFYKKISPQEIEEFKKNYQHSDEEKLDVLNAYKKTKGNIDKMLSMIMCSENKDIERFIELIEKSIAENKIKKYSDWSKETIHKNKGKRRRREMKEEREAKKAAKELGLDDEPNSLALLIQSNQEQRKTKFGSFISSLETKYNAKKNEILPTDEEFRLIQKK